MSVVYSILFIYFLSAFGETIAWICVVVLQLFLFAVAGLGWYFWDQTVKKGERDINSDNYPVEADLVKEQELNKKDTNMWLAVMVVGGVLAGGFLCCLMCNLGSLRTAIDVIDASADFLAGTKRIIAVPFFFFLLQMISVAIWVPCMAYVTSMNHISPSEITP